MKVTRQTIDYIANLARLELEEDEAKRLTGEMGDIISYVEKLGEINTDDIKPKEHVIPLNNVLREDVVIKKYTREEILEGAPDSYEGAFKVPKVVE